MEKVIAREVLNGNVFFDEDDYTIAGMRDILCDLEGYHVRVTIEVLDDIPSESFRR